MKKVLTIVSATVLSLSMVVPAFALSVAGSDTNLVQVGLGGGSGSSSVSTSANTEASSGSTGSEATVDTNATIDVTAPDIITRAQVDSNATPPSSANPADVQNQSQVSGFVSATMKADDNLSTVETSRNAVQVTYKQPARFLGVIPTTINATATINADGSYDISYPWYAFVFTKNQDTLDSKVKGVTEVDLGSNASTGVAANGKLSASTQAKLISDLRAVMWSELNASGSASASADTSASVQ